MWTCESKQSKLYKPRTLFDERRTNDYSRSIPDALKESLKLFLRKRASILMSAPDIDNKTYSDHPLPHELSDDECAEDVSTPYFYDDIGWPHKWASLGYRPSGDTPEYRAMQHLDTLHKSLKHDDTKAADVIKSLSESLYWSSTLSVWLRVRTPKNEYGNCVEDIDSKRLRERMPEDIAEFVAVAHNTLIDVLAWLDRDLSRREADALEAMTLYGRKNECIEAERRLLARERRHATAVAKNKGSLAAKAKTHQTEYDKVMSEARQLMLAANQRMEEAMLMARLAADVSALPSSIARHGA